MRRRLFNALCLLSLVLAIAVAVLWMRSYRGERWARSGPRAIAIVSWRGSVMVEQRFRTVAPYSAGNPPPSRAPNEADDPSVAPSGWQRKNVMAGQWVGGDTLFGFGSSSVTHWATIEVNGSRCIRSNAGAFSCSRCGVRCWRSSWRLASGVTSGLQVGGA